MYSGVVLFYRVFNGLCETKVANFGYSVTQEYVLGFQIPMEDVAIVEERASSDDISEDFEGLLLGQLALILYDFVEIPSSSY